MRVLVFNWLDRENPQAGGAEIHLHEVFGRLVRRGYHVTLLCSGFRGGPSRVDLDGIEVHRTGTRHTFGLAAPAYFRRRLSRSRFDVLIEDLNKVPLFSPLWTPVRPVLLVHHLFGEIAFEEASTPVAAATWLLERPLSRVYGGGPAVAVSESTARDLARRGLDRDAIDVIPNGVDVERFRPDDAVSEFPEPTILYMGRLKRYKRVDLIIKAVALLRDRDEPCNLIVAGRGDDASHLWKLRDRLGLQERVRFTGWVDEDRKIELLRRSWLHVFTSSKEGWGITTLEAGACGTPTVASDSPGLRDSVVDGQTGMLVPHEDIFALAEEIKRLLADADVRHELGRGGRRFAEEHSWDAVAECWDEYLSGHGRMTASF